MLPIFKEFKTHEKTQFTKELIPSARICPSLSIIFISNIQQRMHLKGQEV